MTFMNNVAENENAVADYYLHYIGRYDRIRIGRMEYLAYDFISFLRLGNEKFNEEAINLAAKSKIGEGTLTNNLPGDLRSRINYANKEFCAKMGYLNINDY